MSKPLILWAILSFAVSAHAEEPKEPSCVDRHRDEFDETCAPAGGKQAWLPLERWKKECAKTGDRDKIIRQACLDFYTNEIPRAWGENLTEEAWNKKCLDEYGPMTPRSIIQEQCRGLYVPHYASSYDLSKEGWRDYCKQCVRPRDILAIFKDQCYSKYKQHGMEFAEWKYACDRGFEGKDPAQYVENRKKSAANEARLTESRGAADKAGKKIGVAGVKAGAAPSGEGLDSYFDGGGGIVRAMVGAQGAINFADKATGLGLGEPQRTMGNLDQTEIPAPGELKDVRSQLVRQVDALERQRVYDARMIGVLREILEYTPEHDAVALDDGRRTIETFYNKRPSLKWSKGDTRCGPGFAGCFGGNRVEVRSDVDDRDLAALLIHEVGGHGYEWSKNAFLDEKDAYDMELRHYSNRIDILTGRLRQEQDAEKKKELQNEISHIRSSGIVEVIRKPA